LASLTGQPYAAGLMRRRSDPLYAIYTIGTEALRPSERHALDVIQANPGLTIEALREALQVARERVWQIVAQLERHKVIVRQGDPRTRVGKFRNPPPSRADWRQASMRHQAMDVMLALECLAERPHYAAELSRKVGCAETSARRLLLLRLEVDGYAERVRTDGYRIYFGLSAGGRGLGRRLRQAPS